MIANPLLNLRWSLLQQSVSNPREGHTGAQAAEAIAGLRAQLQAVRPILQNAPGLQEGAASLLQTLIDRARHFRLLIKLQVSELVLAYVMVQSLHFVGIERERGLTPEERRFGRVELGALMESALELLQGVDPQGV